jgi:hypothetical protein
MPHCTNQFLIPRKCKIIAQQKYGQVAKWATNALQANLCPSRFRDTIEVLHDTNPELVRLSGIDCLEKGHVDGKRAKQAASAFVFGKDVIPRTHGQDKYERTLADVVLSDGMNVNHELVKEGWCWWYRK